LGIYIKVKSEKRKDKTYFLNSYSIRNKKFVFSAVGDNFSHNTAADKRFSG
jgi:hypothetical protein